MALSTSSIRVAIVTGASSGIGRATAIALSDAGWSLSLTARRQNALEETAKLCGGPTSVLAGDVTDEAHVKRLFEETVSKFGRLDMVFNNAGIGAPQVPIEEASFADFTNVIHVNLLGPWLCTREAFRVFKSQNPQGGRIINNGSIAAHAPRPHTSAYTCSKHAITGLTRSTAIDGRAFDITVTQIDIGNALTDMSRHSTHGALQANGDIVKEASFDVKHVADAVVHVASLPNTVTVLEMTIMAHTMPYIGRG